MSKKAKRVSRGKQRKTPIKKGLRFKARLSLFIILVAAMLFAGYSFYYKSNQNALPPDLQVSEVDPAALRGGETRPTLSPALFTGKTARAYYTAQGNRELLDSVYCYCNCKKTIGHKSLLSCFAHRHAASCTICQDQAFYAAERFQKVGDIAKVRLAVDKKFWRPLR
jgi:hypothetical protein